MLTDEQAFSVFGVTVVLREHLEELTPCVPDWIAACCSFSRTVTSLVVSLSLRIGVSFVLSFAGLRGAEWLSLTVLNRAEFAFIEAGILLAHLGSYGHAQGANCASHLEQVVLAFLE